MSQVIFLLRYLSLVLKIQVAGWREVTEVILYMAVANQTQSSKRRNERIAALLKHRKNLGF